MPEAYEKGIIVMDYLQSIGLDKSKDSLAERQDVIDLIKSERYDVVHIIGHSLGKADLNVFEAIDKSAKIICYYHDTEDCKLKEAVLNSLGFNYEMVSDACLYT